MQVSDDPTLDRLKQRWARRSRAPRPGALHLLSALGVIAGGCLVIVGSLRPWVVIDGVGFVALSPGGGADEALATGLVVGAGLDIVLGVIVIAVALRRRRARFLHASSILISAVAAILLRPRIRVDEHQTVIARLEVGGADSHLGVGLYLVVIGLVVAAAAPFIAFPEILRALRA